MDIAIVGAGPRGLSVAERLVAHAIESKTEITIKIFDPYSIGGRVWDPAIPYNKSMLMNTVSSQISMFVDDSIENPGLIVKGPNMYEWMQQDAETFIASHPEFNDYRDQLKLGSGDYTNRGLMGVYASWFYQRTLERMPNNVTLRFVQDKIVEMKKSRGKFKLTTEDQDNNWSADFVVLATGHAHNKLSKEEASFNKFAEQNDLTYVRPGHPSEANLDIVAPKENVIVRGLGLSWFDYMAEFSLGRGGKFTRSLKGELKYKKSGKEPIIFAGSRGGMPLTARGINKKKPSELYEPLFFTRENLDSLIDPKKKTITYDDFFALFDKEIQYKHYLNVSQDSDYRSKLSEAKEMLNEMSNAEAVDFEQIARNHGVLDRQIWNWQQLLYRSSFVDDKEDLSKWFVKYLDRDIEDAKKDNINAPYSGAFDILRDVRDSIRYIVEHDYFETQEYAKFLANFTPINVLLSVGPPIERIEQMRALIKAGVLTILGPGIAVETDDDKKVYVATTKRGERVEAKQLVEARLSSTNINTVDEPLQKQLLKDGIIQSTTLTNGKKKMKLGAVDINRETFHYIDKNNRQVKNVYSFGIPHEGLKWFETVIPRPGVNTVVLREASQISNLIFEAIEAKNK
ncbi:MAG: FAD/NAD(P)-binding protein [Lactobacillaceae bacterium]|jgi:uncharacterized NAD(P)/FAD-binding protein YdhS|nr:FAD/NAD(P)-binding protein [Lactobacillaceae bacterium]